MRARHAGYPLLGGCPTATLGFLLVPAVWLLFSPCRGDSPFEVRPGPGVGVPPAGGGAIRGEPPAARPPPPALAPCDNADNQSQLNSFLWTIRRDPPSFFFGTIHVPYQRVWHYIPENTKEAFYRADNVFFELNLVDPYTISDLASCQLLPDGETLADVIPRDIFVRLKQHLDYVRIMMPSWVTARQRARGFCGDSLFSAITGNWERKRPVWIMLMVNSLTENDVRNRGVPVLDLYLAQEAQRLGKRTGAVEYVEEQCVPLNELNFNQVLFALNQTLWQHETQRFGLRKAPYATDGLIGHYNCGDLDSVLFSHDTAQVPNLVNASLPPHDLYTAKRIDSYFRKELIYKRNQRMAQRIEHLLNKHPDKSFFFAFGAGHYLGNHTVIDELRPRGFDIQHTPPTRQLQFGRKFEKKRRKMPPLLADITDADELPPVIINKNLQILDPFAERRHHRHRHGQRVRQQGRREGRRREGDVPAAHPRLTDSHRLQRPQFHDLWVRLEASRFDTDTLIGRTSVVTQAPVYAMYNTACRPAHTPAHTLSLLLALLAHSLVHSFICGYIGRIWRV